VVRPRRSSPGAWLGGPLTAGQLLSYAVGGFQVLLALLVAARLGRVARARPWLGALIAYFALRGLMRIAETAHGGRVNPLSAPLDGLLLAALLLLLVGLERTIRGLLLAHDAARYRELEYERALADYRRLARHRLANPLAAIRGGISALRSVPALDDRERGELLELVEREAATLERVALDPITRPSEERVLGPEPRAA
jgi:signal transduction histidine kinase